MHNYLSVCRFQQYFQEKYKTNVYPTIYQIMQFIVSFYSTQEVAEGLLELVTDETKNGAILKMSKLTGKDYVVLECKKMET